MNSKVEKHFMLALLSNMIFDNNTFEFYIDKNMYNYDIGLDTYMNRLTIYLTIFTQDRRKYIKYNSRLVVKQLIKKIQETLGIDKPTVEYGEVFSININKNKLCWYRKCYLIYNIDSKFIENIRVLCKMNKSK